MYIFFYSLKYFIKEGSGSARSQQLLRDIEANFVVWETADLRVAERDLNRFSVFADIIWRKMLFFRLKRCAVWTLSHFTFVIACIWNKCKLISPLKNVPLLSLILQPYRLFNLRTRTILSSSAIIFHKPACEACNFWDLNFEL